MELRFAVTFPCSTHRIAAGKIELCGGGVLFSDGPDHEVAPDQKLILHLIGVLVSGELQPHGSVRRRVKGDRR